MSFRLLQKKTVEICQDIGTRFGEPISTVAADLLRDAMGARLQIPRYALTQGRWILAEPADFAAAADALHAFFSQETGERVQARVMLRGSSAVLRPSAVWLEGETYRVPLIEAGSYQDAVKGMVWKAELTEFARVAIWGWRHPDTKKKLSYENASEHAAQKSMRLLFESHFDLKLDSV